MNAPFARQAQSDGLVLRSGDLIPRLKEMLRRATHVDIATAWATGGEHLRLLAEAARRKRDPVKVRALVGIAGNATRPDALRDLLDLPDGDLRIAEGEASLFHPKLYVFRRHKRGTPPPCAWIGSANFTNMGFGGGSRCNEEIMLEVGHGPQAEVLASWFDERWEACHTNRPVSEIVNQYGEGWKPSQRRRDLDRITSGSISKRVDLLADAHRPLTFEGYREALNECDVRLKDRAWSIFGESHSYMTAIPGRRRLLLGEETWSRLSHESQVRLKGGTRGAEAGWWGLIGRIRASHWPSVQRHEDEIRQIIAQVRKAEDEFPRVAATAMEDLMRIKHVGPGTASLLLTLARPGRFLSVNDASARSLARLSGTSRSTLGKPQNYARLLSWLYNQPWYSASRPEDEDGIAIWRFRAALVDAFVYDRKE